MLADGHHSSDGIATLARIKELCGGSEDAELVVGCLLLQNKARYVSVAGGDQVEVQLAIIFLPDFDYDSRFFQNGPFPFHEVEVLVYFCWGY